MNSHARTKTRKRSAFGEKLKTALLILLLLLILFLIACFYGGYRVTNSRVNLPGLSLDGVEVGGLTQEATAQKLRDSGWDDLRHTPLEVRLPLDVSFQLDREQTGVCYTPEEAAARIFALGHEGHWAENLQLWLQARFTTKNKIALPAKDLNENYVRANVRAAADRFRQKLGDGRIRLDRDAGFIRLTKGGGQLSLDEEELYRQVVSALERSEALLDYSSLQGELNMPDFDAVYRDVAVETQDAHFNELFEIVPEVVGCSFDTAYAAQLWQAAQPGEEIRIPLTLWEPNVHAADLEGLLYRDRLCFMTTYFGGSTQNRVTNIQLAASKLDGLVILPGQVFSYNETVGQRTEEAGFLSAPAYADGEVVEEIGGGICQVSSTLYCAALYAQMTTVTRTNHYFAVSYLSMGYDATVSWKSPDYKFRNDRDYPVRLVADVDDYNNALTIEFWGTNVDGSHVSPYSTSYELYDETYPDVLIGYSVTTVCRVLDANDNQIRAVTEPTGIYHLHDEDIAWPAEKRAAELKLTVASEPAIDPIILAIQPDG